MIDISVVSAFLAGLLTFLAPCTLPILPGFISFLAGAHKDESKWHSFMIAVGFAAGFSVVFIMLGILTGIFGTFFIGHRTVISQVGGIIIIIFGLSMLGLPLLTKLPSIILHRVPRAAPKGVLQSVVFGTVFALSWSPCLGPVLGTILILATTKGGALNGALLLFVFSLGYTLPFLVLAGFLDSLKQKIASLSIYTPMINKVGGVLVVIVGLSFVFGNYASLGFWANGFDITSYDWVINRI
jgi:cytochrome c-type biogenesis protein